MRIRKAIKGLILDPNRFYSMIICSAPPGSGKSYNITELLEEMKEESQIIDYYLLTGKITMQSVFTVLEQTSEQGQVLFADDIELFGDEDMINLVKSGTNTGSNPNVRKVSYISRGVTQSFLYEGFIVIATNTNYRRRAIEEV